MEEEVKQEVAVEQPRIEEEIKSLRDELDDRKVYRRYVFGGWNNTEFGI